MIYTHNNLQFGGAFRLSVDASDYDWTERAGSEFIHIIWNNSEKAVLLEVDSIELRLPPHSITTTTYYHHVAVRQNPWSLVVFSFNKPYYCIYDHDSEVSCNGIIFYGAQRQAVICMDEDHQRKYQLLLQVFIDEFQTHDNIQGEMLVMLLKRLIIITTRLAKRQIGLHNQPESEVDLIRQFNFLVDQHFR
ncbi:MAG: AraC family transcriptional regulator, partial [Bacteroidota bacterium]